MRDHIKILGLLNIVWSSIGILAGLIVLLVFGGLAGALGTLGVSSSDNAEGLLVAPFFAVMGIFILILVTVIALPALIGGIGLLKYRPWSRILMIVVSVLHLFSVPIGTALGAYGLWVLLQEDARRVLDPNQQLYPPAPPLVPQ